MLAVFENPLNGLTGKFGGVTNAELGFYLLSMGFDYIDREIDEEDRDGFKRTRKFAGYPGFEAAQYDGRNAEMQGVVIIEERFVVALNIEGRNVDKDIIEHIFDDFPFRRLRRLAQ